MFGFEGFGVQNPFRAARLRPRTDARLAKTVAPESEDRADEAAELLSSLAAEAVDEDEDAVNA